MCALEIDVERRRVWLGSRRLRMQKPLIRKGLCAQLDDRAMKTFSQIIPESTNSMGTIRHLCSSASEEQESRKQ